MLDVDEQYMHIVIDLLSNLKENIVKNIAQLNRFHRLIEKSDNKIPLTMKIATDTGGMVTQTLNFTK